MSALAAGLVTAAGCAVLRARGITRRRRARRSLAGANASESGGDSR
jgi:hypothetical protein